MSRLTRALLLTALTCCLVVPSAGAVPTRPLGVELGDLWTIVIETPTPENPFATGRPACVDLGGNLMAPFTPLPGQDFTCTVNRGTRIFVAANSWECSTFAGDHFDFGTTEEDLRACARQNDAQVAPMVTVDGRLVAPIEVETQLRSLHLPEDNIFGSSGADRSGQFVAHGWIIALTPLAPGTHTITSQTPGRDPITTTIIVR